MFVGLKVTQLKEIWRGLHKNGGKRNFLCGDYNGNTFNGFIHLYYTNIYIKVYTRVQGI